MVGVSFRLPISITTHALFAPLLLAFGCAPRVCPVGYEMSGGQCAMIAEDSGPRDAGSPDAGRDAGAFDATVPIDAEVSSPDAFVEADANDRDARSPEEPDAGPGVERCDGHDSDRDSVEDAEDPDALASCVDELPPNVEARCGPAGCYATRCLETHLDCGDAPGCETASDALNCGECGNVCAWCANSECDGVVELSSGWFFTCALRASGAVYCWGYNADGRLGDGTMSDRSTPVRVTGLSDVVEIDAGEHHACARTRDGEVWCWGRNDQKQLAIADTMIDSSAVPVLVLPASAEVVEIAAGGFFSCARTAGGRVLCWGSDSDGQIGNGSVSTSPVAQPFDVGLTDIEELALGTWHACARRASGAVVCWGANLAGQLGDNSRTRRTVVPSRDIVGLSARAISAGNEHSCAIRSDGQAICWGANTVGALGIGSTATRLAPLETVLGLSSVAEIETGHAFSCARTNEGRVYCWGEYSYYQLAANVSANLLSPPSTPVVADAVELSVTGHNGCARLTSGAITCWGADFHGQLGNGTVGTDDTRGAPPALVSPP